MGEICHWLLRPLQSYYRLLSLELIAPALSKPGIPPPALPVWELAWGHSEPGSESF